MMFGGSYPFFTHTKKGVFMRELWAPIDSFPAYSVSTEGRVRNDFRERIVNVSKNSDGWSKVKLYRDGYSQTKAVKLLVAEAFLPRRGEKFNTVVCLDGDQSNVCLNNLVWRPRWFAWQYTHQFYTTDLYRNYAPIRERKTGIVYDSLIPACLENGLLFYEVSLSLVNNTMVFPDWQIFDFVNGDF